MKTITALKQQSRNPNRVNVYLDGEFAFGLSKIVAAWLKNGQTLSSEDLNKLQADDENEKAFQRALNFLSYRPRSTDEVRKNLHKHQVAEEVIEVVIQRLVDKKLLDDADFAKQWVENRNAFRPRGRFALQSELRQKGISDALIQSAVADIDEPALARAAIERKLRQFAHLDYREYRKKVFAHLARRGFAYEIASEVCDATWAEIASENSSIQHNEKRN